MAAPFLGALAGSYAREYIVDPVLERISGWLHDEDLPAPSPPPRPRTRRSGHSLLESQRPTLKRGRVVDYYNSRGRVRHRNYEFPHFFTHLNNLGLVENLNIEPDELQLLYRYHNDLVVGGSPSPLRNVPAGLFDSDAGRRSLRDATAFVNTYRNNHAARYNQLYEVGQRRPAQPRGPRDDNAADEADVVLERPRERDPAPAGQAAVAADDEEEAYREHFQAHAEPAIAAGQAPIDEPARDEAARDVEAVRPARIVNRADAVAGLERGALSDTAVDEIYYEAGYDYMPDQIVEDGDNEDFPYPKRITHTFVLGLNEMFPIFPTRADKSKYTYGIFPHFTGDSFVNPRNALHLHEYYRTLYASPDRVLLPLVLDDPLRSVPDPGFFRTGAACMSDINNTYRGLTFVTSTYGFDSAGILINGESLLNPLPPQRQRVHTMVDNPEPPVHFLTYVPSEPVTAEQPGSSATNPVTFVNDQPKNYLLFNIPGWPTGFERVNGCPRRVSRVGRSVTGKYLDIRGVLSCARITDLKTTYPHDDNVLDSLRPSADFSEAFKFTSGAPNSRLVPMTTLHRVMVLAVRVGHLTPLSSYANRGYSEVLAPSSISHPTSDAMFGPQHFFKNLNENFDFFGSYDTNFRDGLRVLSDKMFTVSRSDDAMDIRINVQLDEKKFYFKETREDLLDLNQCTGFHVVVLHASYVPDVPNLGPLRAKDTFDNTLSCSLHTQVEVTSQPAERVFVDNDMTQQQMCARSGAPYFGQIVPGRFRFSSTFVYYD